jgi:drug/metabolite transporter (DMT)-like permease
MPEPAAPLIPVQVPWKPDNMRGLLLMGLGFFMFAASDVQVKLLAGELHPVQIVWTRQLGLLCIVGFMLATHGTSILATKKPGWQIVRGALAVLSASTFIYALRHVELADAVAVTFVAPFIVTIFSALLLKEPVGLRRLTAVTIGFVGTLIVIRPGMGVVHPALMLVLFSATAFALRQILSRHLAATDKTPTTVAYTAIASVLLLSLPLPFFWTTPESTRQIMLLAGMAVCAALGEFLVIKALEIAHASVIAPIHYTLIIWATMYGWLVFGQLPDQWTWLGASIIVATGLYIMNRERQLTRATKAS